MEANESFQTFGVMNEKEGLEDTDISKYRDSPYDNLVMQHSNYKSTQETNFKNSKHPNGNSILGLGINEQSSNPQPPKYCVTCRTRAKMGNNLNHCTANGIKTLTCDNEGCTGYIGHAPTPRIHRTYSTDRELLESAIFSDCDTSDDVPLLVTDMNKIDRKRANKFDSESISGISRSLSEEELSVVDHCHSSSLNDNLTKKIGS